MGCAGDPNAITPNIDNLAEYGTRFTRACANFPLCCPARGTLLTGRHAHHVIPGHDFKFPEAQPTIADVFNENGYRTAWFGKWHVEGKIKRKSGNADDLAGEWQGMPLHPEAPKGEMVREAFMHVPPHRGGGFEHWLGYENNNSPHNLWVQGHDETGKELPLSRLPKFETDALTDELITYLERRAMERQASTAEAKPFFASLSVQPPHDPYGAPERFMRNYNPASLQMRPNVPDVDWVQERARRDYAGACALVENLDWNLGRIREALRRLELDTNTLIIFFSDHGDMHGSHGQFHKTSPWEESTGIPMIIGGGLDIQGNGIRNVSDAPISLVDLAPTTLSLCGITPPAWMQGKDFSFLRKPATNRTEEEAEPDSVFLQCVIPTGHGDSVDRAWRGIVTKDGWKYVCFEGTDWLLFDLNTDPYEAVNLAHNSKYNEKRCELRQQLRQWVEETGDRFRVPE